MTLGEKSRLNKQAANRVAAILKEAYDRYESEPSLDVNEILTKAANDHEMPVAHAGILARGWNTVTQNSQRMSSDSATEKYASFPLADAEKIRQGLTPCLDQQKKADAINQLPSDSFAPLARAGGIAHTPRPTLETRGTAALVKTASARQQEWEMSAGWEKDLQQLRTMAKKADLAQAPVAKAREQWLSLVDKIAGFFQSHSPLNGSRAPWQDFEFAVRAQHGPYFDALLDRVYQTLPFKEARDRSRPGKAMLRYDATAAPFADFEAYRQHGSTWLEAKAASEKAALAAVQEAERFAAKYAADIDLHDPDEEEDHCDEKMASVDLLSLMEPPPALPAPETALRRVFAKEGHVLQRVIRGAMGRVARTALESYLNPPAKEAEQQTPVGGSIFDDAVAVSSTGGGSESLPGDIWDARPEGLLWEGKIAGIGTAALSGSMGGMLASGARTIFPPAKATGELVDDVVEDLTPPSLQAEKRNIKAQTILSDLLANDDVIAGHDADQVLRTYNEIASVAPRVAVQSALVRPWLHRLLAGRADPFELQGLADLESSLQKNELAGKAFAARATTPAGGMGGQFTGAY